MAKPLVSVIVPAYNAMPWLAETLASICAQTMTDLEVIVVDDGSTDDTAQYALECSRRDSRVRCLSKPNGGLARARNSGMAEAVGRYLTFLDSDDLWAPEKLARQLQLIEGRPRTAVLSGIRRFYDLGGARQWSFDTAPRGGLPGGDYLRSLLFLRNTEMVGIASCLAPAEAWRELGGYDPALATAEDWDMWLRAARRLEMQTVPGEPLQFYRKRAGSLTTQSSLDRDFDAWRTILRKQVSLGGVSAAVVRQAIAYKRLECAEMNRVQRRWRASLRDLWCSLASPTMLLRREFPQTSVRLLRRE
jgi:glycosyltransferase involved in cell wall biosynthesis